MPVHTRRLRVKAEGLLWKGRPATVRIVERVARPVLCVYDPKIRGPPDRCNRTPGMGIDGRYDALSGSFQAHDRQLSTADREGQRIPKARGRSNAQTKVVHRFHKRGYCVFHSIHRFMFISMNGKTGLSSCENANTNTCSIYTVWA